MNIAPPDFPETGSTQPRPLPVARRPLPNSRSQPPNDPRTLRPGDPMIESGRSQRTPEMTFSRLIAQLSRQLKTLEQTFMRALSALARNVESGTAAGPTQNSSMHAPHIISANPYDGLIRRSAQRHELDPALLTAVVRAESGFNSNAVSSAGAMGLMQLMPDTARSLGVSDPYNPDQNVEGGATLLRSLIDRYGGRLDLALAAYNAGPGAVDKYNGVPPYAETQGYVNAILADYRASALGA